MIVLISIPVFIRIVGEICRRSDRKAFFCAAFAVSVFAVCGLGTLGGLIGADAEKYDLISTAIDSVTFENIPMIGASPAFLIIMKICRVFTTEAFLFPLVISLIQTALAVYAVCSVCSEPYSGASVILFCFIPAYFAGSAAFTAALICMTASRYFKERRFFRAAALILAAACFDMSALLIIPIYFIAVIPNIIISVGASAFIAALAAVFPGAAGTVFDFLGSGKCTSAQFPVPCAVIACAAAGFAFLMYTMFRNRGNDCEKLVPVLCCGAAFSVASIFVPELFALTQMLLMMSVPVLAPDALEIGEKFIGMLFPEKKGAAQTALLIACVLAEAGVCAYLIFGDVFGASVFDSAFLSGVQL